MSVEHQAVVSCMLQGCLCWMCGLHTVCKACTCTVEGEGKRGQREDRRLVAVEQVFTVLQQF